LGINAADPCVAILPTSAIAWFNSRVMEQPKAIIFDLDGVLVDTEPVHKKAELQACREYGFEPPGEAWAAFKGIRERDIFAAVAKRTGAWPVDVDDLIRRKTDIYLDLIAAELPAVSGSVEFVRAVKDLVGHIGLATSTTRVIAEATLRGLGVRELFDDLVTGEDVKLGKPAPEIYQLACSRLGLKPQDCLVVEDSDNGTRSAVDAGCRVAGITTSFPRPVLAAAGAHLIVDGFPELLALLAH
jgi:HAD superfamily hydrolase (TIGR01509 family)